MLVQIRSNCNSHMLLEECEVLQPLWKTVWQFLVKLYITFHEAYHSYFWICTQKVNSLCHFIVALFVTVKSWNQLR